LLCKPGVYEVKYIKALQKCGGPWLQVMSPQWLVEEVKGWLTDTIDRYKYK
jgi:hypothetical protein